MKKHERVLAKFDELAEAWLTEIEELERDGCPGSKLATKRDSLYRLNYTIGQARDELERD